MDRIKDHPILEFEKGPKVTISFEGNEIECYETDTIVSALSAAGITTLRHNIGTRRPQGLFCAIGKCSSCLMEVDGVPNVRTCITLVKDGMTVARQDGKGVLHDE